MGQTPRGIRFPEEGDHTRLWEHIEDTALSVDEALHDADLGLVRRSGLVDAGAWGQMPAQSAYAVNITPGLSVVRYAVASWNYLSRTAAGYLAPGTFPTARSAITLTVGVTAMTPTTVQLLAYFPLAYTPDARGGEGITWTVFGTL